MLQLADLQAPATRVRRRGNVVLAGRSRQRAARDRPAVRSGAVGVGLVPIGHVVGVSLARELCVQWPWGPVAWSREAMHDAVGGILVVDCDNQEQEHDEDWNFRTKSSSARKSLRRWPVRSGRRR